MARRSCPPLGCTAAAGVPSPCGKKTARSIHGKLCLGTLPGRSQSKGDGKQGFGRRSHRCSGAVKHLLNLQKSAVSRYAYPLKTAKSNIFHTYLQLFKDSVNHYCSLDSIIQYANNKHLILEYTNVRNEICRI